jgi:hypothetical protein
MDLMGEIVGAIVFGDLGDHWESLYLSKDFVYGMITMYVNLNWDKDDSSYIITHIKAIDTVKEFMLGANTQDFLIEEYQAHTHNLQLLDRIRRKLEEFMDDCLQELNNF